MNTKRYFVKNNGENYPAISGRFGDYCKRNGFNYSTKDMLAAGFEIQNLTTDQVKELNERYNAFQDRIKEEEHQREMQERERNVEICLNCEPLEIGEGNHLWTHITDITEGMKEAYHGCGKGTAYIKDGKIIAFHYGYDKPVNAPKAEFIYVDFSCYQILF